MADAFVYQPHVEQDGEILTPDLLISTVRAVSANGESWPVPVDRLTTATTIQQVGPEALGIAAAVAIAGGRGHLVTLGSLHGAGFAMPALLTCAKPVCRGAWRLDDVVAHFDRIVLRSWHVHNGRRGDVVEAPLPPRDRWPGDLVAETAVFLAPLDPAPPATGATGFAAELHDPVLKRTLSLSYATEILT